jgi:hypothetical protein
MTSLADLPMDCFLSVLAAIEPTRRVTALVSLWQASSGLHPAVRMAFLDWVQSGLGTGGVVTFEGGVEEVMFLREHVKGKCPCRGD